MLHLFYKKAALKTLQTLPQKQAERILTAIESLPKGDVKALQGKHTPPLWRLRVGNYRVIFSRPTPQEILILLIDSRGDIYKGL